MRLSHFSILIFLISIVVVSGCKNNNDKQIGQFKGGLNGIEASFMPTSPTSEFNKGDNVPVKVLLKNKGENDITQGEAQVKLFGIHHQSFGLSDQYKPSSGALYGTSEARIEGGEQQVDMGMINYNQDIVNFEEFDIKANICYPYATLAIVNACISSTTLEQGKAQKACSIEGEKIAKGDVSSAPIQVTSITEKFRSSDQLWLDISIENKGKGTAYNPSIICSDLDDITRRLDSENILDVKVPDDMQCAFLEQTSSSGQIRLGAGKALLRCSRNVKETSIFEKTVRIELKYKYLDTITKHIKIFSTTTGSA
ncbi:MAG: hypothetical protein AABW41_05695 [Nanoarchaeota archaeon]